MNTSIQTRIRADMLKHGDEWPEPGMAAHAATEVGADEPLTSEDMRWVYGWIATPLVVVILGALVGWLA